MSLPADYALPATLPVYRVREALVQRICWTAQAAREPAFRSTGKYRFDDPKQSYGTLYCARDFGTCFFETLLRGAANLAVSRNDYEARSVVLLLLDAERPTLVDLYSTEAVARLGLDLSILSADDYTETQAVSSLVHEHPQQPDGIVYRSRFDPEQSAIALFSRARTRLRRYPASPARRLTAVPELAAGVRNLVPFRVL